MLFISNTEEIERERGERHLDKMCLFGFGFNVFCIQSVRINALNRRLSFLYILHWFAHQMIVIVLVAAFIRRRNCNCMVFIKYSMLAVTTNTQPSKESKTKEKKRKGKNNLLSIIYGYECGNYWYIYNSLIMFSRGAKHS